MKKSTFVLVGFMLLILLVTCYSWFITREKPEYVTLNIPMPQPSSVYSSKYAESEEFSTFIWNDSGLRYYIYRMYVSVSLDHEDFDTKKDVEQYYDTQIKSMGWMDAPSNLCDSQMSEFRPNGSYRAYVLPSKYYVNPLACLIVWSEFELGTEGYLSVLIKTINPSKSVLWNWDL